MPLPSRRLYRRPNDDVTAGRSRHSAANEHQILFFTNADHLKVLHGATLVAHLTGHLLPLEDAARVSARADGPRTTKRLMGTVRGALALKAETSHHSGKALALARAGDVNHVAGSDHVGSLDLLADLILRRIADSKLRKYRERLLARFGKMLTLGLADTALSLVPEANLDRLVAVVVGRADLRDGAGNPSCRGLR